MFCFYFYIYNGEGVIRDEEGIDVVDDVVVFYLVVENICFIVVEDVWYGLIDLEGCIDVVDVEGWFLLLVFFVEVFEVCLLDDDVGLVGVGLDGL